MSKTYVRNSSAVMKKVLMCPPTFLKAVPINEIAQKWKDTKLDIEKLKLEHNSYD